MRFLTTFGMTDNNRIMSEDEGVGGGIASTNTLIHQNTSNLVISTAGRNLNSINLLFLTVLLF